ncbi:MAG: hypothetical protein H9535_20210 [Ignavibacteria bacterium]|nr:hypothetical protein [Ignavibacteria bacterium]
MPAIPNLQTTVNNSNSQLFGNYYGRTFVPFAQVDKANGYFRRIFVDSLTYSRMKAENLTPSDVPTGALILMETWFGSQSQGTVFVRQRTQQGWADGSFSPSSPNFLVSPNSSCQSCHQAASPTDNMFTQPLLIKAIQRNKLQRIQCDRGQTTPCDLSVYQGN